MSCGCEVLEERVGDGAKELEAHLTLVGVVDGGWTREFLCPETGRRWLEDWPDSRLPGGGDRRLTLALEAQSIEKRLPAALPEGWRLQILERSAGVYEVAAQDSRGRKVATTATDIASCIAEVVAGAWDLEAQSRTTGCWHE